MSKERVHAIVHDLRGQIEGGIIDQNWVVEKQEPGPTLFAPLHLTESVMRLGMRPLLEAIVDEGAVDRYVENALHPDTAVYRILAVLIWINCDTDILKDFVSSANETHDSDLPLDEPYAKILLGQQLGAKFYRKQFIFCPVILQEDTEIVYKDSRKFCRLPFEDFEFLGKGSSGTVCRVTIPKGHFQATWGVNQQPQVFAWKQFSEARNSVYYEKERENLDIIKSSSLIKHPNISLAVGSLIRGDLCSLYFKAADCDLGEYLESSESPIPRDNSGVYQFLRRFCGVMDALKFLHNDLVHAEDSVPLRFAHLDLKPANILVLKEAKGEIWKVHDFGFSRVSQKSPSEGHKRRKHLLPPIAANNSISDSIIPRDGSFLSPETNDFGKVSTSSDVWGLGTILSLVISFLDAGPSSIKFFRDVRKKGADAISDHFFVRTTKNTHKLNPGVRIWFETLQTRLQSSLHVAEPRVVEAIGETINLLEKRILLIKPDKRASSHEMQQRFNAILSKLNGQDQPDIPKNEADTFWRRLTSRLGIEFPEVNDAAKEPARTYELSIPVGSRKSKFSHCSRYISYLSPKDIAIYKTDRILMTDDSKTAKKGGPGRVARLAKSPTDSNWENFQVGSKYLVATTDLPVFDCYVYPHTEPEQQPLLDTFYHFRLDEERSKIHEMALSPDNKTLIHVLQNSNTSFHIYLSRISDMISWLQGDEMANEDSAPPSTTSMMDTPSIRKSSTWSWSSISPPRSSTGIVLPWRHIRLDCQQSGEICHIQRLQFSVDSQLLTLSSEPLNSNECTFYAWKVDTGRYVNRIILETPGNIDTSQVWITAFATLMSGPSILIIEFQRALRQCSFIRGGPSWKSVEMDIQLLDILPVSSSDDRCLFIGRDRRRGGTIKALYIERNKLKNGMSKLEFQYTVDLECEDWIPGRDSAATLHDGFTFLCARVDGTGYLKQFSRDNAPTIARG